MKQINLQQPDQKKIIMLMPYFGRWPEWFAFYLESCRWNSTIDWLFFTDCALLEHAPENVRFVNISYADYCQLISEKLDISFVAEVPYKLCDVKPAYGLIHQEYIEGYDYFGFGDVDVIYGDLRAFYTDDVLRYNTLSTLSDRVSGHLFLLKNEKKWICTFERIQNWRTLMSDPENRGVDEYWFTKVLRGHRLLPSVARQLWGIFDPYKRGHLFEERHATPLAEWPWIDGSYNYPERWYWYQGKLLTEFGGEFMYLHFMNWKSSKYLRERYGNKAAWETLANLVDPNLTDLGEGWCISPQGFTPLTAEDKALLARFGFCQSDQHNGINAPSNQKVEA